MTLFNPVFNCLTPIVIKRSKTQADEGLTPADEAGYVFLSQPPAPRFLASTPSSLGKMTLGASHAPRPPQRKRPRSAFATLKAA